MRMALMVASLLLTSGPSPTTAELLHAINLVRDQDLESALIELERLCPMPLKELPSLGGGSKLECQIRKLTWGEKNVSLDAKSVSQIYWLEGDTAHKRGELHLAEALLDVAVHRDPNDAGNWHSIGLVYRDLSKRDLAIRAFQRSLELDPREPYTMYWLASTLIDDGQLEPAESTLDAILEIDPDHARVWFLRGEIRMIRGDYKGAIEAFMTSKKKGVPRSYVAPKIRECERMIAKP